MSSQWEGCFPQDFLIRLGQKDPLLLIKYGLEPFGPFVTTRKIIFGGMIWTSFEIWYLQCVIGQTVVKIKNIGPSYTARVNFE